MHSETNGVSIVPRLPSEDNLSCPVRSAHFSYIIDMSCVYEHTKAKFTRVRLFHLSHVVDEYHVGEKLKDRLEQCYDTNFPALRSEMHVTAKLNGNCIRMEQKRRGLPLILEDCINM